MKQKRLLICLQTLIFITVICAVNLSHDGVSALTRTIVFPVIGTNHFSNDFDSPRATGPHHAIDIIAGKGQKLVAAVNGTVTRVNYPEPDWGYSVSIRDSDGFLYTYIHINDDNPGTNDDKGGAMHAYAPYMKPGNPVVKGQLIGWVGDSGFSNGVSHLHFEIHKSNGDDVNPYNSLVAAKHINTAVSPPLMTNEIAPFGNRQVGVSIAFGNFDLDLAQEMVVGAGKNEPPKFKLYDDSNALMNVSFFAESQDFKGGIDVATADFNNDGIDEIITGRGAGDVARVKVFKIDGTKIADFSVYGDEYKDGVNVSAGDLDGDNTPEIATGPSHGDAQVRAFELDGIKFLDFAAYSSSLQGGCDVTVGDINGDGQPEIITGPGPGTPTRVKIWDKTGGYISSFYPYGNRHSKGVRVSAGNVRLGTPQDEILTVPSSASTSQMKLYDNTTRLNSGSFLEDWWLGYNDVAAGDGVSKAATGINRRASVWPGIL